MATAELKKTVGYHNVSKEKARELILPHTGKNGFYLLRPSGDTQGTVLCTVCVTHNGKILNYRISNDQAKQTFFVNQSVQFSSMADLIAHYRQHPLNEATGSILVKPVGAAVPAVNGTDDCYVIMEKPEQSPQAPQASQATPTSMAAQRYRKRPLPPAPTQTQTPTSHTPTPTPVPTPKPAAPTPRRQATPTHTASQPSPTPTPTPHTTPHHTPKHQSHPPHQLTNRELPGLHKNLSKSLLKAAMQPYLNQNGWYLLRPSSTSEAQLTLTVSHSGRIVNFKINNSNGQYYITPKVKFHSIQELVSKYHSSPIRSKQRGDQNIMLLRPIPVDPNLEQVAMETMKQQQQLQQQQQEAQPPPPQPDALPPPWQEFYSDQYRRPYYHNPATQATVWERPRAPGAQDPPRPSSADRVRRIQQRPLPSLPQENGPTPAEQPAPSPTLKKRQSMSGAQRPAIGTRKRDTPLPPIPGSEANSTTPSAGVTERPVSLADRPPAPLPTQEEPLPEHQARQDKLPPSVHPRRHASIGSGQRPRPALPTKEEPPAPREVRPPLNPKLSQRELPPLPPKDSRELPPLPDKEQAPPFSPSLPQSQQASSEPHPPPTSKRLSDRKKIIEYEDIPQLKQRIPPTLPEKETATPALPEKEKAIPPLPEKERTVPALPAKERVSAPSKTQPPPPLPVKDKELPPLPKKDIPGTRVPPPLPVKEDSNITSPPPSSVSPPPAPPLKVTSPPASSATPPPPPVPPVGAPPPPPPPGIPPASPIVTSARRDRSVPQPTMPSPDPSGGRPFTASDLVMGAQRLRKVENSPEIQRHVIPETGGGLEGTLNRAIAEKFRNVTYSDSEEEFDDVDDEWEDD